MSAPSPYSSYLCLWPVRGIHSCSGTKPFGAERGGLSASSRCSPERRRAGPKTSISLSHRRHSRPQRRATGHPCPLTESLSQDGRNRKEGGTLSRCLRHPFPSRAPSLAHRRTGSGTSKDKGRETRAKVGPWRGPFECKRDGVCYRHASGVCSVSAHSQENGRKAGLHGHRDAASAMGFHPRLAHLGPRLTPVARSWAGARRCRQTGVSLGTQTPGVLLVLGGPAEAEEQPSGKRRASSFFQGAG